MSIKWKRGDLSDHIGNHCHAESIYEREVGDTLQVIERIRVSTTNAYERASYRLVETRNDKAMIITLCDTLKETRGAADRRIAWLEATNENDPHELDMVVEEDETWRVICACGWEAWNQASELKARTIHGLHVRDPLPNVPSPPDAT